MNVVQIGQLRQSNRRKIIGSMLEKLHGLNDGFLQLVFVEQIKISKCQILEIVVFFFQIQQTSCSQKQGFQVFDLETFFSYNGKRNRLGYFQKNFAIGIQAEILGQKAKQNRFPIVVGLLQ